MQEAVRAVGPCADTSGTKGTADGLDDLAASDAVKVSDVCHGTVPASDEPGVLKVVVVRDDSAKALATRFFRRGQMHEQLVAGVWEYYLAICMQHAW